MFEDEDQGKGNVNGTTKKLPPRNRQEWSSRNGMSQWPSDKELVQASNNPLDILEANEPITSLGTLNEINRDLRDHSSEKYTAKLLRNATC